MLPPSLLQRKGVWGRPVAIFLSPKAHDKVDETTMSGAQAAVSV